MSFQKFFTELKHIPDDELLSSGCRLIHERFVPQGRVYLTRSFGKREEFITGYGDEQLAQARRIPLISPFSVFIQSDHELAEETVELIRSFFIVLLAILDERSHNED